AARAPPRSLAAKCTVTTSDADVRFQCQGSEAAAVTLNGRVTLRGTHVESGEIAVLSAGNEQALRLLDVSEGQLVRVGSASVLTVVPSVENRRARLGSG